MTKHVNSVNNNFIYFSDVNSNENDANGISKNVDSVKDANFIHISDVNIVNKSCVF